MSPLGAAKQRQVPVRDAKLALGLDITRNRAAWCWQTCVGRC